MTFTDDPSRDYERFCDAQDHGAGDDYELPFGGTGALERAEGRIFDEERLKKALNAPPGSLVSQSIADVIHDNFVNGIYQQFFDQPGNCERIHDEIIVNDAEASAALAADGDAGGWGSKLEPLADGDDTFRGKVPERVNADPRGKFWDGGEPVRHEELYREDLEAPEAE